MQTDVRSWKIIMKWAHVLALNVLSLRSLAFVILIAASSTISAAGDRSDPVPDSTPAATRPYLITNDDQPPKVPTSSTLFKLAPNGLPEDATRVSLGGVGAGGGYFAASRVSVLHSATAACAFLSIGSSGEISALDLHTQRDIGDFAAASTDSGRANGIGLVNNGTYLYASFSSSNTIATFSVLSGCGLQFLGDITPLGKHQGNVKGMAVHGNVLVVAYGEGSIESFNVAAGVPVANDDLQNSTGYALDRFPSAVDISPDGRFAIFGDMSSTATVEVSDISSGKLKKTVLYNLGSQNDASNVLFSPDGSLIYVANTGSGKVTAAFFDTASGKVSLGCISETLKGFNNTWTFLAGPVTEQTSGTGSVLYLAEFGSPSSIAVIDVSSSGGQCSLKEKPASPIVAGSNSLLSIGMYPPRPF
jgi:6-phosphogluconolactonase (cycloisomerase 2 family)